jgi:hypothetical protein
MLRRDYFLRMLNDLMNAIARLMSKDGPETERRKEIEAMYSVFGGDKDFFRIATETEVILRIAETAADANGCDKMDVDSDEMIKRIELLAALMYADYKIGGLNPNVLKNIAERALSLYQRVELSSDTFSEERRNRIDELITIVSNCTRE